MKLWPSIGTRSVLFGVHQFLWHSLTVGLAWRRLYKKWPTRWEWIAIFFHDLGYWGCSDMDGESGRNHPLRSAMAWARLSKIFKIGLSRSSYINDLILGHSRHFAQLAGCEVSRLCDPDKLSLIYDPLPFYWLRASASREIVEYAEREGAKRGEKFSSCWAWLKNYRRAIGSRFADKLKK